MDPWILAILADYLAPLGLRLQNLSVTEITALETRVVAYIAHGQTEPPKPQILDGGIAVIQSTGVLVKTPSWWAMAMGMGPVTLPQIEKQFNDAAADPSIKAIVHMIDSPGGTVAGTAEAADAIARANKAKPVISVIRDVGASGAYYLASQGRKIYANRSAVVGSIGVYAVITDFSKAAEMDGIKIHVVKAGEMKGAGTPGTAITEAQLAEKQREITHLADTFVAAIARGRGWSEERARTLADGRVHVGTHAVEVGLIDGIKTLDEVVAELAGSASSPNFRQESAAVAQATATQGDSNMNPRLRKYLVSIGLKADATDAQATAYLAALSGDQREIADGLAAVTPSSAPAPVVAVPVPAPAAVVPSPQDPAAVATLAERTRIADIHGLAMTLNLGPTWSDEMIRGGFNIADAREKALAKYAQSHAPVALGQGSVHVAPTSTAIRWPSPSATPSASRPASRSLRRMSAARSSWPTPARPRCARPTSGRGNSPAAR